VASVRRLSAIMFTDMVGSTASAQTNEAEALKLRDEQEELVRSLFAAHQGREIKSIGDGFLAEFDSALRAVQCAIDIQQHLHERNSQPGVREIRLRIGIHLGDVEQRQADIFGDAVNIASRIEPLSAPGGLSISGQVYDQIRNKIPNTLEKLPPTQLKGVQVPIDVYRVVLPWTLRDAPPAHNGLTRLAVLPFTNMSPDPADLYFADGLTEELITVLSQMRELRVIARTSVMQYKSAPESVSRIGAALDVSSILEGSVRRAGNRLRITAQLIDVRSQEHVWAKSYDRELDDVFAIQSEIAKHVAEALKVELKPTEAARLEVKPTVRPESYLAYLKGRTLLHAFSRESIDAARVQFELAISIDDRNAAAHSGMADVTLMKGWWYPEAPVEQWLETARRSATRALELDSTLAEAHVSLGMVLWCGFGRNYAGLERELKLALSLNPSYALAHYVYGGVLEDQGRRDEAILQYTLSAEADPLHPSILLTLARTLVWSGRLDEALVLFQKAGDLHPSNSYYHYTLAEYYLARGDLGRAIEESKLAEDTTTEASSRPLLRALRYALEGDKERARALLQGAESSPNSVPRIHTIIRAYARLGDVDDCYRWMEQSQGVLSMQSIRLDPQLELIRRDPRFVPFLQKINLNVTDL
jgi:adenylate cyclase